MLRARQQWEIPEATARLAQQVLPAGNRYLRLREQLGPLYRDEEFGELFVGRGRPAESPGVLAMVTVLQFAEGLTDRQAAEAVGTRIDWKYVLGLELDERGIAHSVLSEFRERLIEGGQGARLLDSLLVRLGEAGWVKARGRQRTDSTHVLAAVRQLNRLECVGETLRCALNDLAEVAPAWLRQQVSDDWFLRYSHRFEQYRLPASESEQQQLRLRIGTDGFQLLQAVYAASAPPGLRQLASVQVLRQVWLQQYYQVDERIEWRTREQVPPNKLLLQSPYDPEARNRTKRQTNWTGYAVQFTESCDADLPHLITHVETTPATTADVELTSHIHDDLAAKGLLPAEHLVDTSYVDADHLATSQTQHQIDLVGPAPSDPSWQARTPAAFPVATFQLDWDQQRATCPQGHTSQSWRTRRDAEHPDHIEVRFDPAACRVCPLRTHCVQGERSPRTLLLHPKAQHDALLAARQRQTTPEFKQRYKPRAGIEATHSQAVRTFDLRRSRYIGLTKTALQHIITAVAINLARLDDWLTKKPPASAKSSVSRFAALAIST